MTKPTGKSPAAGHLGQCLDRVDRSGRSRISYTTQRTEAGIEDLVLEVRHQR
jgi:hypothetical protein